MKSPVEKRKPNGILDYTALALTTFGVGYIPGAPGTYGSVIAVAIYLGIEQSLVNARTTGSGFLNGPAQSTVYALVAGCLLLFSLVGIWASNRSIALLGNDDPSEAVVDELMGQFVTLTFIPFGVGWPFILAGFLLFRLFDIWKPYPIDDLQILPGGLGICADDIIAGVYAGICLAGGYAVYLAL
jgi:phosphatidylglycerophosphatase A